MTKKTTILSINGGGIHGILPGVILSSIEDQLRSKEGNHVTLSDCFDLMAGTSIGGILICLLVTFGDDGRLKYKAHKAVDLYLKNGTKFFSIPFGRGRKTYVANHVNQIDKIAKLLNVNK